MPTSDYTPSVQDVGNLLVQRTVDGNGNYVGTFNSNTRPNDTQVNALIVQAVGTLSTRVGEDVPTPLQPEVKQLAALRAAMLVEASFFPDEIRTDNSLFNVYKDMWEEAAGDGTSKRPGTMVQAIERYNEDATTDAGVAGGKPYWSFPPNPGLMTRIM